MLRSWFADNTAGIVTRHSGFQRRLQDVYILPVVVEDSGYPAQSSTSTLTIRVCFCEAGGSLLTCSAEAVFLPVGLSTGALMAIVLCVALLIGKLRPLLCRPATDWLQCPALLAIRLHTLITRYVHR